MMKNDEAAVNFLKEMIDKNGPSFLIDEPYEIYTGMIKTNTADRKTAAAILYVLVNGILKDAGTEKSAEELSERICSDCGLNKRKADQVAGILHALYSDDHKKEWKNKDLKGLKEFIAEEFRCTWKGYAVWDAGNGTVDCHYEAEIVLEPTETISADKELAQKLKKNPFMTKIEIHDIFEKRLKKYLDDEFEEYCTCDDYYQPVVEDFDGNLEYDLLEWCKKNGFEFVSCDGDGDDDGYEPKFRRGWY